MRVEQRDDGTWGFWARVWVDWRGPYKTREDAQKALDLYCAGLDSGQPPLELEKREE